MINSIRVTPRRKNEPLFSGTIQITENDWRIYNADLMITKDYQLELLDTLRITQQHGAVTPDIWKTRNQVLFVSIRQFGFYVTGNFVNVYSDYNVDPGFGKNHFGRTILKYDTAFNKKDSNYWNAMRPVALENDERRDFVFKDSLSKLMNDSARSKRHLDSLRKNQKPITLKGILWSGQSYNWYNRKSTLSWNLKPLITQLEYNTVEGLVTSVEQQFVYNKAKAKYQLQVDWNSRYGFSNGHFNSYAEATLSPRRLTYRNRYLRVAGGKRVSQFNHDNPIDPLTNAVYTLVAKRNYLKIYENWFGKIEYNNILDNGVHVNLQMNYENRIPLQNTSDYSFFRKARTFSSNHPEELSGIEFRRHQALIIGATISWQPGQHYIEFPWGKMPLGSDKPSFELKYNKGLRDLFGSDIRFDKWEFSVSDKMNFKMGGEFHYRVGAGGFSNRDSVGLPDLRHFNGNQTFYNINYLNSFQLAPYYRYSNAEKLYLFAHAEHHFNGLLTNKVPLLNKLKWNLVGGANSFYVNKSNYYVEVFAGLENILKLFRVDFVNAYQGGPGNRFGVRVGLGGLIGGKVKFD
jgi:hypothetical protein